MAKGSATWKRVKFGEVVRLNKETCKDPASERIERVIGLEHLEPGDLRVRSWGDVAAGTTFTNRVRPGQVLFGKRRAYQRKVAVADFDAICSGDISCSRAPVRRSYYRSYCPSFARRTHSLSTQWARRPARCRRVPTGPASPRTSSRCRRWRSSEGCWNFFRPCTSQKTASDSQASRHRTSQSQGLWSRSVSTHAVVRERC